MVLNIDIEGAVKRFESIMQKKMLVKSFFYKRAFGGKGFEFEAYRAYTPVDDSSLIDWKASSRSDEILVRQYSQERDLNIFVILDVGDNMVFGSGNKLKVETSAEIIASLGHLILSSGDKFGFALISDKIKKMFPFSPGMKQFFILLKQISDSNTYGGKSNLGDCLKDIKSKIHGSSLVFIISDFLNLSEDSLSNIENFMRTYKTIGIMLRDKVEDEFSDLNGEVLVEDIYTGEQLLVDPELVKEEYSKNSEEQKNKIKNSFKRAGGELVEIFSNEDFVFKLSDFLRRRIKGGRR